MKKIFGINKVLAMKIEEDGRIEIINNRPKYLIPIKNMSDVPLLKKNIPVDKRELMTIMEVGETHYLTNIFYGKDVLDALRKLNDYINRRLDLLKFAGMYYNPNYENLNDLKFTQEVYELLGVKDEMNKVFGVLDSQDDSIIKIDGKEGYGMSSHSILLAKKIDKKLKGCDSP